MTGWLARAVAPSEALSVGTSRQQRTRCPSAATISSSFLWQAWRLADSTGRKSIPRP